MTSAVGRLRYGPRGATVPRRGRWLVLECDPDWFRFYVPMVHRELPGRWASVIDDDRDTHGNTDGVRRAIKPRLGLVKPRLQEPAWGPHVSVIRGERFTGHDELWDLGITLGDTRQELFSMQMSKAHSEEKVSILRADLASMRDGVRPKYRRRHEQHLAEHRAKIANRETRMVTLRREEDRLIRRWRTMQGRHDLPEYVMPGAKVTFGYSTDLRLIRSHWFLDVKCRTLGRIRQFFGLDVLPVVPFHLTVAVTAGS